MDNSIVITTPPHVKSRRTTRSIMLDVLIALAPAAICGIAGNYVGSGLALKGGAKIIRPMFFVVLALLVVRLVYDLVV